MIAQVLYALCLAQSAQTHTPWGFAHNDYEHRRPLLDSIDSGIQHVEADVFLVRGKFLVAHDLKDASEDRTLDNLYLKPLYMLTKAGKGSIFSGGRGPFWLMVDIKSAGENVYRELELLLAAYRPMLVEWTDEGMGSGAVAVVLSGNRPTKEVARQSRRWVAVDGRPEDVEANPPVGLMPWISTSYLGFKWPRQGPTLETEAAVGGFVRACHEQGRKVRFWAIPDNPSFWQKQLEWGVDLINTDRPAEFAKWLSGKGD
jgi:hypothetical protein